MKNIENKIKFLLTENKLTQKELCDNIGMSTQNLRKIFDRNSIETRHLQNIANVFQVPMSFFFEEQSGNYTGNIKNSTVISAQNGSINYKAESEDLKTETENLKAKNEELRKNNLFYWDMTESLIDNISEVYVKIVENSPKMKEFLADQRETRRFIAQINTLTKFTEQKVQYNKKFFDYFENPY